MMHDLCSISTERSPPVKRLDFLDSKIEKREHDIWPRGLSTRNISEFLILKHEKVV